MQTILRHISPYKLFEDKRPVISYDFDGCLHTSVHGMDPIDFVDFESWEPFTEMHDQLRLDAENHKIVVVTARAPITNSFVWDFINKYELPIEEIYATNNFPKTPILKEIKAIKHYDDNIKLKEPLKLAGIEFVLVDPKEHTQKLMESSSLKNFVVTFVNEKFYTSDNTLKSFLDKLKKLDPDLIHDPKQDGKGKNQRIIYVKSILEQSEIKKLMSEFEKNYDWLKMNIITK